MIGSGNEVVVFHADSWLRNNGFGRTENAVTRLHRLEYEGPQKDDVISYTKY